MSAENPRYYKWYPTEVTDLGTMPFDGDWTVNDRIVQANEQGIQTIYYYNINTHEFGRNVMQKVGNRMKQVWQAGVSVGPVTYVNPDTQQEIQMPVWFMYYGDGVCTVKLPNGEQPEPVEI